MNWLQKIFSFVRQLFVPGAAAYNEQRSTRIIILSILIGILTAVAVGVMMYYSGVQQFRR